MPKVITGAGLNEFISSGKVDEIKADLKAPVKKDPPALEVVKDKPASDVEPVVNAPAEDVQDDDDTQSAMAQSEKLRDAIARKNATINRKHREMREAQEAAREAERFAENQYNRARMAEDRAAQIEKDLAEAKGKAAPAAETAVLAKPDPQKFYNEKGEFKAFEYAEELAAYAAKKAVEDDRSKQVAERQAAETAQAEAAARARIADTIKKHPDFEEVMRDTTLRVHNRVLEYLSASENIGEVSYYLAKHPDYVERINKLHPLKAVAEIGKLELTFESKDTKAEEPKVIAAKVVPGAPPPITPLTTNAGTVNTNTDPSKMSFRELRAYERSRAAAKRR
jgi:hypothetical protein